MSAGSPRGARPAALARIDVVVFDWDGTLVDSESRIVGAAVAAIEALGLPPREPAQIRSLIGLGLRECVQVLYPGSGPGLHERFVEHYRQRWASGAVVTARLFPGAREVAHELHRRGYRLAVATGKSRRGLDRELAQTGLAAIVEASRCADEAPSKPDPRMLLDILEMLDVEPERALVVGDTAYDLLMARSAGAPALGATYGVHERTRLLECRPLGLIEAITELPDWL